MSPLRRIDDPKKKEKGWCAHCWEPIPRGLSMTSCEGCRECAKISQVYPIPLACIMPWLFKEKEIGE